MHNALHALELLAIPVAFVVGYFVGAWRSRKADRDADALFDRMSLPVLSTAELAAIVGSCQAMPTTPPQWRPADVPDGCDPTPTD